MTELRRKGRPATEAGTTRGAGVGSRAGDPPVPPTPGKLVGFRAVQLELPLSTTFRLLKVLEKSNSSFRIHSWAGGISAFSRSPSVPLI